MPYDSTVEQAATQLNTRRGTPASAPRRAPVAAVSVFAPAGPIGDRARAFVQPHLEGGG